MLSIDKNQIMMEHFKQILFVSSEKISIAFKDRTITVTGNAMKVIALGQDEILIEGVFSSLEFLYES